MPNRVVVGAQWGDEGKAKIVDVLTQEADIVVRFQGGANAGHTVIVNGTKFIFHLIPAGLMHPEKTCVIGNGVVFEPAQFLKEVEELSAKGVDARGRLFVSDRASVVMPYHKLLDTLRETRLAHGKIGTTGRGIGPAYVDKVARVAIRVADLLSPEDLAEKVRANLEEKNFLIERLYGGKPLNPDGIIDEYTAYGRALAPFVADTTALLHHAARSGKRLLFEGAQGTVLDVDHGTYPFVTSSNTVAGAACTGSGVGPTLIDEVIGVTKAYTTRVGNGPFPTEIPPPLQEKVRELGQEFGATTGRPRRCGWFDAVLLRRSVEVNGISALAVTKLDVLSTLEWLKICIGYKIGEKTVADFPNRVSDLERVAPVYEEMPGWKVDLSGLKSAADLPGKARDYLARLSELSGAPITMVSVGPDRAQTFMWKD